MTKKRRVMKRRNTAFQRQVDKGMWAIWADGIGILPYDGKEVDVHKIRKALSDLVRDEAYWNDLITMPSEPLKKEGFQLP